MPNNKNWTWDDHKYKSREWVKGKWQYTYNTIKNTANKVKETTKLVANDTSKFVRNTKPIATSAVNGAKVGLNQVKEAVTTKVQETTKVMGDKLEQEKKNRQNKIDQQKEEIKKIVENNMNKNGALPVIAIVGIGILSLLATKVAIGLIATAVAINEAINDNAEYAKTLNNDNETQRRAAKLDDSESKANLQVTIQEKNDIMKKVNPNYNNGKDLGYAMNCYSCSLSYDMQRRGYDNIEAIYDEDGEYFTTVTFCYQNAKVVDMAPENPRKGFSESEAKELMSNMLNDYPEGAYGNFCVTWTPPYGFAGGHSMIWEIENGEVVIRDCQSNKTYTGTDVEKILKKSGSINYFRADNLEVNEYQMNRFIQEKGA